MNRNRFLVLTLAVLTLGECPRAARAAWPHDPNNGNLAVCTAPGNQFFPMVIADGAGGTIVAWQDLRNAGDNDVYAQRYSAAGVPQWPANGVLICGTFGEQDTPVLVADGAGGAVVVWKDRRTFANYDVYAQRVNASGAIQWAINGVALCIATGDQGSLQVVSDGTGGAIVAWLDPRIGPADVYAQRVSGVGVPQWTVDGVIVCNAAGAQTEPTMVADVSGGAIVAWADPRTGTPDIFAQHVSSAGAAQWTANGVGLCLAANFQTTPVAVADGAGGAIVSWPDNRGGSANAIYAQRVSGAGAPQWTVDGVPLCTAANNRFSPAITTDGSGGAIVTWYDGRSVLSYDTYTQRVNAAGTPQWTADGVALCLAAGNQFAPIISSDGAGGAIVSWIDLRSGTGNDIYAQRIGSTGVPLWMANGVAMCTAPGDQPAPLSIATDGDGGAVVTWHDGRSGGYDIYAQRIERFGQLGSPEAVITSVRDVKNDQGGFVKVSWTASYLDADPVYGIVDYRLWRSVPAAAMATRSARARGITTNPDLAAARGDYLQLASAPGYAWELAGSQPASIFANYSLTTATTSDSIAASNPRTAFLVEARAGTTVSANRWSSAPDSGYSVDNLPPAPPALFNGVFAGGTTYLHWTPNVEPDLAGYRLYRGTTAGFAIGPGTLLQAVPDTGYADAAGAPFVYKLTAVDAHGNESLIATLLPSGTVGVGVSAAGELSFAAPKPNPARGVVSLEYFLPRSTHVQLALFDLSGRRVQTLRDGVVAAGAHHERLMLTDRAGCELASGVYVVRFAAGGRVITRRLATIR